MTPDGSALRDYIDVRDLSYMHFLSAKYLIENSNKLETFFNVGSGKPVSVLEIIDNLSKLLSLETKYENVGRNSADPDKVWANNEKFFNIFKWKPKYSIESSLRSFIESVEKI